MIQYTFKHELTGDTITIGAESVGRAFEKLESYLKQDTYWTFDTEKQIKED